MSYSELHGGPAPRILVLAGPNGSGKSTVTKKIPPVGLYVNADQIQRNKGCSSLEAAQEAEQIRNILLDAKQISPLKRYCQRIETWHCFVGQRKLDIKLSLYSF